MPAKGPIFAASTREDTIAGLRAVLLARGLSEAEFAAALAQDRLDAVVIDRLLLAGETARTGQEVSDSAEMEIEQAARLWRALGFPAPGEAASFNEHDVEALSTIRGLTDVGVASLDNAIQVTRVLGQSMSRLADTLVSSADATSRQQGRPEWAEGSQDDGILLAAAIAFSAELVLPSMERLIIYAWRRHVEAAARRHTSLRRSGAYDESVASKLAVGFADMVGFTALSSQLSAEALVAVVDRFEELAHGTVVAGGGRPVKMIGDEVMFVCDDPVTALRIGLDLVDAYSDDELLSDVRVGLAAGPVLLREGDFFGPTVNRAARVVSIADPGSVLCSDEIHAEIGEGTEDSFNWRRLRPRTLKDIGRVSLWSVRRAGDDLSPERQQGTRWRRLSEVSSDLAALRQAGQQAVESLREN